ncbi:MAG: PAC2 family protein [Chloroflexota bacterium]
MDPLRYLERPEGLRNPILIYAFDGWADASEVATWTARYLVRQWKATKFAEIDSEDFYVFTEQRPKMRWGEDRKRFVEWPANEFYYHRVPVLDRDFIILAGSEPQLRWKSFAQCVIQVISELQVSVVLALGGVLAAVPHTQPPRLSGTATDELFRERLHPLEVNSSRYEGPTGILGVLNTTLDRKGVPTASLWGSVPHYLAARPNMRVAQAMLRKLDQMLDVRIDMGRGDRQAVLFDGQVSQLVAGNAEVQAYVRKLEEEHGRTGETAPEPPGELPSGEAVIRDLEDFFRERRGSEGGTDRG